MPGIGTFSEARLYHQLTGFQCPNIAGPTRRFCLVQPGSFKLKDWKCEEKNTTQSSKPGAGVESGQVVAVRLNHKSPLPIRADELREHFSIHANVFESEFFDYTEMIELIGRGIFCQETFDL